MVTDLKERFEREVSNLSLSPDAFQRTIRRVARRRRTRRIATTAFALLVAGVGIGSAVYAFQEAPASTVTTPSPSVETNPLPRETVGSLPALKAGGPSAAGFGSIWVVTCNRCTDANTTSGRARGTLFRIDSARRVVVARIPVIDPVGLAIGAGGVWVSNFAAASVQRVDPATNRVVATIPLALPKDVESGGHSLGFFPENIAAGNGAVWVVTAHGAVARIDPKTNRVVIVIGVGRSLPDQLVIGDGSVWVTAGLDGVIRIDERTNEVVEKIAPLKVNGRRLAYSAIAAGSGYLWVAGGWVNTAGVLTNSSGLVAIDAATGVVVDHIDLLGPASQPGVRIAFGGDRLFTVAGNYAGEILLPSLHQVPRFEGLPAGWASVVIMRGSLWAVRLDGSLQRMVG